MGLTFSRSLRFGPLRFNFSGSGIGISAGIPGLRIGSGPRGAYINAGSHGFRYRASLGGRSSGARAPANLPQRAPLQPEIPDDAVGRTEYATGDVMQLTDASAADLLQTMNAQAKRFPLWVFAIAAGIAVYALIFYAVDRKWLPPSMPVAGPIVLVLLALGIAAAVWYDKVRRLTVLFYDLDGASASAYESFINAFSAMAKADRFWAISEEVRYSDTKYHAGANAGVNRKGTSISFGTPSNVRCNIAVPLLATGATQLALFPERALVFQGRRVGGCSIFAARCNRYAYAVPRRGKRSEGHRGHRTNLEVRKSWRRSGPPIQEQSADSYLQLLRGGLALAYGSFDVLSRVTARDVRCISQGY